MTLNRNPENYFQEIEQVAFAPGTLVPRIEPSDDKLLQGRLFSYFDTQRHRIGGNFQQIPINTPKNEVFTYNQNGYMSLRLQKGNINFQPATAKPSVHDNKKFIYSRALFQEGTTTVQVKIDKENNFKHSMLCSKY